MGEHPNDSNALIKLLINCFPNHAHGFFVLVFDLTGDQLNTKKGRKIIRAAYLIESPAHVIYTRDLDALASDAAKKREREKEFEAFQTEINGTGIFLLNIYELETLILSDIGSFNKHYSSSLTEYSKPMEIEEPKEELKRKTSELPRPYNESHNPEVFEILNPDIVKENCKYFRDFLAKLKQLNIN